MEKTFAREIYKHMVVGVEYKLTDLMIMVDTEQRLPYFPQIQTWEDLNGFDFKEEFRKALRVIEDAGYVYSKIKSFKGYNNRGKKYGSAYDPSREYQYTARVWMRLK